MIFGSFVVNSRDTGSMSTMSDTSAPPKFSAVAAALLLGGRGYYKRLE